MPFAHTRHLWYVILHGSCHSRFVWRRGGPLLVSLTRACWHQHGQSEHCWWGDDAIMESVSALCGMRRVTEPARGEIGTGARGSWGKPAVLGARQVGLCACGRWRQTRPRHQICHCPSAYVTGKPHLYYFAKKQRGSIAADKSVVGLRSTTRRLKAWSARAGQSE